MRRFDERHNSTPQEREFIKLFLGRVDERTELVKKNYPSCTDQEARITALSIQTAREIYALAVSCGFFEKE